MSTKRRIALTTDDEREAFAELQRRRATGEEGWDLAEVRMMDDPPRTALRYCVFQPPADEQIRRARAQRQKATGPRTSQERS